MASPTFAAPIFPLEFKSVFLECPPERRKIAVKVVDIFGNDTMKIVEVTIGGRK
jgi:hypothetical protein